MTKNVCKQRIIIVGATSAIAEHCARLWSTDKSIELVLIGRDEEKTERVAADIRVRSPQSKITVHVTVFTKPELIQNLVNNLAKKGKIDLVLIAHGSLSNQTVCQQDLNICHNELLINGLSPVLFAEAFAGVMQNVNYGTLVAISSVAGERGRKSNYVYGSAKSMVSCYIEGLQHRLAKTNVNVILIKPGPTDTPMTAHLKRSGAKLASVENVARSIVKKVEKKKAIVYVPIKWSFIMFVIRKIPRAIFNHINL